MVATVLPYCFKAGNSEQFFLHGDVYVRDESAFPSVILVKAAEATAIVPPSAMKFPPLLFDSIWQTYPYLKAMRVGCNKCGRGREKLSEFIRVGESLDFPDVQVSVRTKGQCYVRVWLVCWASDWFIFSPSRSKDIQTPFAAVVHPKMMRARSRIH